MPNALAVVAHHDDHVLWMGGAIQRMRSQDWKWTLVAMCVPDPGRQRYFYDFCQALGVEGHFFQFGDYQGEEAFHRNSKSEMLTALITCCAGQNFDWVFTHSPNPWREYGHHANHAEVEKVVTSLVLDGRLGSGTNRLAYFSYGWNGVGGTPTVARSDASHYLQPTYDELSVKLRWCQAVPDIGNLKSLAYPCPCPEGFEGDGLTLPDNPAIEVFKKR
jgi:LmbE family N-acetylglucosaminyl deacetylase